jgi:F420H(2)-dependent quinone reductase
MLPRRVYAAIGDVATSAPFSRLHALAYRVFGGRGVDHALGCEILLLETVGRKSGRPHEVPLFAFRDGPHLVVIASRGGNPHHPAWYLNLRTHPLATVRIGAVVRHVCAREASGAERERLWSTAAQAYPGYETYRERTRRAIPVVVLEATGSD